jgi:hypothetical protein
VRPKPYEIDRAREKQFNIFNDLGVTIDRWKRGGRGIFPPQKRGPGGGPVKATAKLSASFNPSTPMMLIGLPLLSSGTERHNVSGSVRGVDKLKSGAVEDIPTRFHPEDRFIAQMA